MIKKHLQSRLPVLVAAGLLTVAGALFGFLGIAAAPDTHADIAGTAMLVGGISLFIAVARG